MRDASTVQNILSGVFCRIDNGCSEGEALGPLPLYGVRMGGFIRLEYAVKQPYLPKGMPALTALRGGFLDAYSNLK